MRSHSSLGGSRSSIVAIRDLPRLSDAVFLDAHRLVDRIFCGRPISLLGLLRRAVRDDLIGPLLLEPVGEINLSSDSRKEPPTADSLAAAGPN